jgi:glyoxylase-like metal-dependent hydrolase (beta-lactamase superfamily II)
MGTTVGRLTIEPVQDGTLFGDPTTLIAGTSPLDWEPHQELLTSNGRVEITIGGFLVRGYDNRIVMIDTGFGADHPECGQLTSSLRAYGVDPGEVTDVVLTHLHSDHIGGVTEAGHVTFPNATYRCHVADWEYFAGPHVPEVVAPGREKLSALLGHLEVWHSSCTLFPGFDVVEAPGHTPGSTIVVLSAVGRRLMILGDVVHCAVQLLEPDWSTFFDVAPEQASTTRRNVIRELEEGGTEAAGGHFPGLRFGRILQTEGRKQFVFVRPEAATAT